MLAQGSQSGRFAQGRRRVAQPDLQPLGYHSPKRVMKLDIAVGQHSPTAAPAGKRATRVLYRPHFHAPIPDSIVVNWRAVHGFNAKSHDSTCSGRVRTHASELFLPCAFPCSIDGVIDLDGEK